MIVVDEIRQTSATRWRSWRRPSLFKSFSFAVAVFLAALAVYPVSKTFLQVFFSGGEIDLSGLGRAYHYHALRSVVANTVLVVGASAGIALIIGSVLAWLNERTDARMGFITDSLPLVPFLLPAIAGSVGWVLLLSPDAGFVNYWIRELVAHFGVDLTTGPFDIYSYPGLILVYTIYQVPYAFLLVSAGLRSFDVSLEQQSRVSGAGVLRTFRKVTLPALMPSLLGALVLMSWSGFAFVSMPLVIGVPARIDILSAEIVRLLTTFPQDQAAAIGLSMIMIVIVLIPWAAQAIIIRRGHFAAIGGKTSNSTRLRLGRWRWPVRVGIVLYITVTTILPISALLIVSLEGYWTPSIPWSSLNLDAYRTAIVHNAEVRHALSNSIELGAATATVGVAAAAMVSLLIIRGLPRSGRILDAAIKFPPTLSHIVLAVGFLVALGGSPFNLSGTLLLLLLAYLSMYYPQTAVTADTAVAQIGQELPEASQVSGASEWRTFRRIYLPLMLGGLVAGWALLFVRSAGDLTASVILAGPDNPVIGTQILGFTYDGSYSQLAALATILTALSTCVVGTLLACSARFQRRKVGG